MLILQFVRLDGERGKKVFYRAGDALADVLSAVGATGRLYGKDNTLLTCSGLERLLSEVDSGSEEPGTFFEVEDGKTLVVTYETAPVRRNVKAEHQSEASDEEEEDSVEADSSINTYRTLLVSTYMAQDPATGCFYLKRDKDKYWALGFEECLFRLKRRMQELNVRKKASRLIRAHCSNTNGHICAGRYLPAQLQLRLAEARTWSEKYGRYVATNTTPPDFCCGVGAFNTSDQSSTVPMSLHAPTTAVQPAPAVHPQRPTPSALYMTRPTPVQHLARSELPGSGPTSETSSQPTQRRSPRLLRVPTAHAPTPVPPPRFSEAIPVPPSHINVAEEAANTLLEVAASPPKEFNPDEFKARVEAAARQAMAARREKAKEDKTAQIIARKKSKEEAAAQKLQAKKGVVEAKNKRKKHTRGAGNPAANKGKNAKKSKANVSEEEESYDSEDDDEEDEEEEEEPPQKGGRKNNKASTPESDSSENDSEDELGLNSLATRAERKRGRKK